MTHEEKVARWIGRGKLGVEIGAFKSPVPGLEPAPVYVDCFKEFGLEKVHADYFGEACHLPFHDNALDYVISSHVIEHVANPVAAFAEWYRVLRPGGIIYLVAPDRRRTWDRPRKLTPLSHLLEDFQRQTTACDPTHIDDFVWGVEDAFFGTGLEAAELKERRTQLAAGMRHAIHLGHDINIHFHTFETSNVTELLFALKDWPGTRFNWNILDVVEAFPANNPIGLLAVVRVNKTWRDRWQGWRLRCRTRGDRLQSLRPGSRSFAAPSAAMGDEASAAEPALPHPRYSAIDSPDGVAPLDPRHVRVQGWVWLGPSQDKVVAVELWAGAARVGETPTLLPRDDVARALGFPLGTPTAVDFFASLPEAAAEQSLVLHLRARLRDGATVIFAETRSVSVMPAGAVSETESKTNRAKDVKV